ncbi:MAG: hypothetical protein A3H97_16000 [Acidobacteria bacterium RIFCSPLOWO2_02_FULL_65_29]|nr:MAG: hypothetical protein A3H97_16000 [Acidobacteria bacterium RIFCSPLOWO2_02_FULL_65_29]
MNAPETAHLAWFRKAEHNLLSISNNIAAANVPWDNVTFDAQQAAEKYLKGFLVFHGRSFPKVHDLGELLEFCSDYASELTVLTADCRVLTRLGAESRYPDAPGEPSEADARQAVEISRRHGWTNRLAT